MDTKSDSLCLGCEPPKEPTLIEQIEADRDRYLVQASKCMAALKYIKDNPGAVKHYETLNKSRQPF